MTTHDLRVAFGTVYQFITNEKAMRERVLTEGNAKRAKLRRCDEALAAITGIKDFAKLHTEEPPEQVVLFDEPERGGY